MPSATLIIILAMTIAAILIIATLYAIEKKQNRRIQKRLEVLETERNRLESAPIMPELAKIEAFLKNEKIEILYNDWKKRLTKIKEEQIPHITDMLLEAEHTISKTDHKKALYKMATLEMEVYKVRENSEVLLNEIKEITTSEERNRAIVTKLKATYRDLYKKFNDTKAEYGNVADSMTLQFENIAHRFEDFERVMENNDYTEVTAIIKSIDEMLKHMTVVIDEMPAIILMATNVLPKRIEEVMTLYQKMTVNGYPLDYLNVEYNVNEANKKISDVLDRAKILNLEDSLFELKVLIEYFDSLFGDFEKEKQARATYEEANIAFKKKLDKMNSLLNEVFKQLDDIKAMYNLSETDLELLNEVNDDLHHLNDDYKVLIAHTSNDTFAYTELVKGMESLTKRLANIDSTLDNSLDAIGSMKEDEVRAREQLEEVKTIIKEAKNKLRDYNIPVIPASYFVELKEADDAIKEIVKELEKTPITISTLNTRVDTARDLALKFYSTTKAMIKMVKLAEMAIVYGNRYRTSEEDLNKNLRIAELLFNKGEYEKSLELTVNSLNRIEPGIYDKLLSLADNKG